MEQLIQNLFVQVQNIGILSSALFFAWGGIEHMYDAGKGKNRIIATGIGLIVVIGAELLKATFISSLEG